MEVITIRPAIQQDAEALLQIYAPYVEKTAITFEYDVPTVEEFAGRIGKVLQKYPYLVAEISGETVGYAYAGPFKERAAYNWAVETTVYVREDMKKHGIGRALYTALEKALAAQGILNMNACIAFPENENEYLTRDSVKFHERMGFNEVGRFHKCGCKFGRWYDMVWMEKLIGEHVENPPAVRTEAPKRLSGGRLEAFENMLSSVRKQYEDTEVKMAELKSEGKERSTTYRQLMANRLRLGDMLAMYKLYDLL